MNAIAFTTLTGWHAVVGDLVPHRITASEPLSLWLASLTIAHAQQ
jgi:hypothetical protein